VFSAELYYCHESVSSTRLSKEENKKSDFQKCMLVVSFLTVA